MTRINAGIKVQDLTDQHLLAEYREIGRVATQLANRLEKGQGFKDIPDRFKLNRGHVTFFLDKGLYIVKRFNELKQELLNREFRLEVLDNSSFSIYNSNPEFYNDWTATDEDTLLVKERISTNIRKSKQIPRYQRNDICKEFYIKNILSYD